MLSLNGSEDRLECRAGPSHLQTRIARIKRAAALALTVAALGLTACADGFRPMYAAPELGGTGLSEKLKTVKFTTIPGRVGQKIRNELLFAASGGGDVAGGPSKYRLDVAIREKTTSAIVERTGDTTARIYTLTAEFRLIGTATGKDVVVLKGTSTGRASLQRFSTIYSNVRALRDAQDRAASTIATDLRGRLEAYLATQV